ncbi:MAG: alpha/beta hydrolase [Chloroflexota bacterium]
MAKTVKTRSHTFEHAGARLHYITAGSPDKPLLLMIHGYTSAHVVWRTTIPVLQDDFFCVAIDLLGHGDSDILPDGDYSIPAQGERVVALADHLGRERFSLIGHSMGGQTSLCIGSMLVPERVDTLISVSGVASAELTPFVNQTTFRMIHFGQKSGLFPLIEAFSRSTAVGLKPFAAFQFASWFHDMDAMLHRFDDWHLDRKYANRRGMRHTWWHGMNAIEAFDARPHLPKIQAKTMALFGAQDNVVPPTDAQVTADGVLDGTCRLIDDCGHFPMFEQTDEYQAIVREFLLR